MTAAASDLAIRPVESLRAWIRRAALGSIPDRQAVAALRSFATAAHAGAAWDVARAADRLRGAASAREAASALCDAARAMARHFYLCARELILAGDAAASREDQRTCLALLRLANRGIDGEEPVLPAPTDSLLDLDALDAAIDDMGWEFCERTRTPAVRRGRRASRAPLLPIVRRPA